MEKEINIKEYLNKLLYLEKEKSRLENIEKDIDDFINDNLKSINKNDFIDYKFINEEKEKEMQQYESKLNVEKPIKPIEPEEPKKIGTLLIYIFSFIVGFIMFFQGIVMNSSFECVFAGFLAIGSLFGLIGRASNYKKYKQEVLEYENELMLYNNSINTYNKEIEMNKQKIKEYNVQIQKKYDKEVKEKEELFKKKSLQIQTIKEENIKLLNETRNNIKVVTNKLKKLYDLDIIFEKYRNLIAIATFFEYYASSRVSELEGKDGAYNLFENEIRQNIIITQLDSINKNLSAIKQNQYILYKELKSINDSLYDISNNICDMEKVVSDIKNVEVNTNMVNKCILSCANQINKNISTIKNITVADFYFN